MIPFGCILFRLAMKVQTRLSIYSSLIFGVIFIIISVLIYTFYYKSAEKSIYQNLENTANIAAWFYLEEDELEKEDFDRIKKQFKEQMLNPFYQLYNEENEIKYGEYSDSIPANLLNEVREKGKLSFATNDFLCYGIFYEDNQGDFVVVTKEKKSVLNEQMATLFWILLIALLLGMVAIVGLSRWIAFLAYKPFTHVINQVKSISADNLDVKIESSGTKDELQDLIDTFNDLLRRISETFIIQKNFVNYVSHEFKTPLASILGNLEVFSLKKRSSEEYEALAEKLIRQIHLLEETLHTLLVISDLVKSTEVHLQARIDELLWEIIPKVSENYPVAKIKVDIQVQPEELELLSVHCDTAQLIIAFYNLIENAVKYSQEKTVDVCMYVEDGKLNLSITDKGIGIPPEQLADITKPFYRADNTRHIAGSGIGLSIALRIFEKNNINFTIHSQLNVGTCVQLIFPG